MICVAAAKASIDAMVFLDAVTGTPMAPRAVVESVVEAAIGCCADIAGAAHFRMYGLQQMASLASTTPQIICKYPCHITHLLANLIILTGIAQPCRVQYGP
jgi:hypothetical protein